MNFLFVFPNVLACGHLMMSNLKHICHNRSLGHQSSIHGILWFSGSKTDQRMQWNLIGKCRKRISRPSGVMHQVASIPWQPGNFPRIHNNTIGSIYPAANNITIKCQKLISKCTEMSPKISANDDFVIPMQHTNVHQPCTKQGRPPGCSGTLWDLLSHRRKTVFQKVKNWSRAFRKYLWK